MTIDERIAHIDTMIESNHQDYLRFWARAERSTDDLHVFNQQLLLRTNNVTEQQLAVMKQMQLELRSFGATAA